MEIWKIRCKKPYKGAHNHVIIAQVIETTDAYVRTQGITFHFKSSVSDLKDIVVGTLGVRIIPWSNIEFSNVLNENFDFMAAKLFINEKTMEITFADDNNSYAICRRKMGY